MSVFKPITSTNTSTYTARHKNFISSSDSGAIFYHAPSGSVSDYSASYISESTWSSIKNLLYSPGCEQYNDQYKSGFYSATNPRICYIPFHHSGDRIQKGGLSLYDATTNVTISDDASGNLYDTRFDQKMFIGNVFYKSGMAVIWEDEESEYLNFGTSSNWKIEVTSEMDIIKRTWDIELGLNEFNYSQNPSSVDHYSQRLEGLGAIKGAGRASYIYTGSNPNRSKTIDQTLNNATLYNYSTQDRIGQRFVNSGLEFSSGAIVLTGAYRTSQSIFTPDTYSTNHSYLIVADIDLRNIANETANDKNHFMLYSFYGTVDTNDQLMGVCISQSSDYHPEIYLTYQGYGSSVVSPVRWSDAGPYPTLIAVKQIAVYVDVDEGKGYISQSIFINGTASDASNTVTAGAVVKGIKFASLADNATVDESMFTRAPNPTASFSFTGGDGDVGSIASGSISSMKFFEFTAQTKPSIDALKTYLHEEYNTGSYNYSQDSAQYTLNPYNGKPAYVTTFGFFNTKNELLAMGKLGRPIPSDVEVPIIIHAELDMF